MKASTWCYVQPLHAFGPKWHETLGQFFGLPEVEVNFSLNVSPYVNFFLFGFCQHYVGIFIGCHGRCYVRLY